MPILKNLAVQIDPSERNGATLLGLNGIVVKSHGGAGVKSFGIAVEEAIIEVDKNVPQQIRDEVAAILEKDDIE